MNYPQILISNNKSKRKVKENPIYIDTEKTIITYSKELKNKIFLHKDESCIIFSHSNIGFLKLLKTLDGNFENENNILKLLEKLQWGFILLINKKENTTFLYNDIHGIYPLYYNSNNNEFIISNNFDQLVKILGKVSFDEFGVYDFLLFNYTLNNRTLIKEIKQTVGGSKITLTNKTLSHEKVIDFAEKINSGGKHKLNITRMKNALLNNIASNLDKSLPIQLPLSGGFDTRLMLASFLNLNLNFSSYTFGIELGKDNFIAKSLAEKFNFDHQFLKVSENFQNATDTYIKKFIAKSPNNPLLLTLLYYEIVTEKIPKSNIVTGKMGGEIITGPVVISEILATRSTKSLISSYSEEELIDNLKTNVIDLPFLNLSQFEINSNQYCKSINNYQAQRDDKYKKNFMSFLSNELYAKFFGIVFNNLLPKYNMINPFMDLDFLTTLLNSKVRFTKNKAFTNNPLSHFSSRKLYAQIAKQIYPPLLNTSLDRGYKLKDVLNWYRLPKTILRYIKNHYLKKKGLAPQNQITDIDLLKPLVIKQLRGSDLLDLEIFDKQKTIELIDNLEKGHVNGYITKKLILILGLNYFFESYREQLM